MTKTKHIDVMVYEGGKPPRVETIENTLEAQQKIVDGYIELIYLNHDLLLVCDEEGTLKNKDFNRRIEGHSIVGTFFVCRDGGEEFESLTAQDKKALYHKEDIWIM